MPYPRHFLYQPYCAALVLDTSFFLNISFLYLDVQDYHMMLSHCTLSLCFEGLLFKGRAVCLKYRICSLRLLGSVSVIALVCIT
jgi:hypothetical protein